MEKLYILYRDDSAGDQVIKVKRTIQGCIKEYLINVEEDNDFENIKIASEKIQSDDDLDCWMDMYGDYDRYQLKIVKLSSITD